LFIDGRHFDIDDDVRQVTGLLAYDTKSFGVASACDVLYGNTGAAVRYYRSIAGLTIDNLYSNKGEHIR
jgi:hypothetical protein